MRSKCYIKLAMLVPVLRSRKIAIPRDLLEMLMPTVSWVSDIIRDKMELLTGVCKVFVPPTPKYGGASVPPPPTPRSHVTPWNDTARASLAKAEAQRKVGSGEWNLTPATF